MPRRPFLLLSLLLLFVAAVQASVSALAPSTSADETVGVVCGPCGPIGCKAIRETPSLATEQHVQ